MQQILDKLKIVRDHNSRDLDLNEVSINPWTQTGQWSWFTRLGIARGADGREAGQDGHPQDRSL